MEEVDGVLLVGSGEAGLVGVRSFVIVLVGIVG